MHNSPKVGEIYKDILLEVYHLQPWLYCVVYTDERDLSYKYADYTPIDLSECYTVSCSKSDFLKYHTLLTDIFVE